MVAWRTLLRLLLLSEKRLGPGLIGVGVESLGDNVTLEIFPGVGPALTEVMFGLFGQLMFGGRYVVGDPGELRAELGRLIGELVAEGADVGLGPVYGDGVGGAEIV